MDNSVSGFPPDIQNQLYQAVQQQRGRGRSHNQARGNQTPNSRHFATQRMPNVSDDFNYPHRMQQPVMPQDGNAFPPLGAAQPSYSQPSYSQPRWTDGPATGAQQTQNQHDGQSAARVFFDRARGQGRGRGQGRNKPQNQRFTQYDYQSNTPYANNDYRRPAPGPQQRLYNPHGGAHIGTAEQQRATRQRIMAQSDYLNALAAVTLKDQLSTVEINHKQQFRLKLEAIAQRLSGETTVHAEGAHSHALRLDSYGSLSNSFGTPGCDVDLLMSVRDANGILLEVDDKFKRAFEGSLLDEGYGARLLTNTRVPILKVCEQPSAELLNELRRYRQAQIEEEQNSKQPIAFAITPPDLSADETFLATQALQSLDLNPADLPLPASPVLNTARIEFDKDCGVQADVNFTNHIALVNTRLLWTYGQCDTRVRQMGLFIKFWAKARDINTPYHGTLSSYGYILMVLHYLMNVIRPPILPNLQLAAKDGWNSAALDQSFEFDTRFMSNPGEVRELLRQMQPNHESLGSLLRGFFNYYTSPQGFNWTQDVISLRTSGGLLTKRAKGWTGAKWSETKQNVRLRYLLAIEDPFETDHNVGRTVGHNGIVAIRNELRRGWQIIEGIQPAAPGSWLWLDKDTGEPRNGFDLVLKAEDRGDLLRRDADERKQKLRDLREKAEREEQEALSSARSTISTELETNTNHGTSQEQEHNPTAVVPEDTISRSLILNFDHQDNKVARMRARTELRPRCEDKDETNHSRLQQVLSGDHKPVLEKENVRPWQEDESHRLNDEASEVSINEPQNAANTMSDLPWDGWHAAEAEAVAEWHLPDKYASQASDNVTVHILAWSKKSAAGRWLCQRDAKIREGSWKPPPPSTGVQAVLNARFPYDPSMTPAELAAKNEILDRLYTDTLHPRLPKAVSPPTQPSSLPLHLTDQNVLHEDPARTVSAGYHSAQETENHKSGQDRSANPNVVQSDGILPWTLECEAGAWLRRRDREICEGRWWPTGSKESVFIKLHELFPYDPTMSSYQLERRNEELLDNFTNVRLPTSHNSNAENMLKAIVKVLEQRTQRQTSKRDTLLDLFSSKYSDSQKENSPQRRTLDDTSSESRQLQALQRVSDSAKSSTTKPTTTETELDRVRRNRLAYFDKQATLSEATGAGKAQQESQQASNLDAWTGSQASNGSDPFV